MAKPPHVEQIEKRLHLAMHGIGARPLDTGAGALRHLEETILQDLRTDGDRLE
jgi:hypothetical protein